jgi:hypothetical protein
MRTFLACSGLLALLALPQMICAQKVIPPNTGLPKTVGVKQEQVNAPGVYPLQATASTVTVKWYDRSDNELGFNVFRRNSAGAWQVVYQTATRNQAGGGPGTDDYSYVDTSTDLSGQCYMIAAYNSAAAGNTAEECIVRPDPSRFPQFVGGAAPQWSGLSNTNDGTGILQNTNIGSDSQLIAGHQTFGVSLTWGQKSLWKIEAQGGPQLMKGQAVALKVWEGGWLKHGEQSFGVDLQLSSTPVYEWYAIGVKGDSTETAHVSAPITDGGTFALWNSSAQAYLVHGYQTWGISLNWYKVGGSSTTTVTQPVHGVKTEQVFNCSIDQHTVEVFIADQTVAGSFVDEGALNEQYGTGGCPAPGSSPYTFSPVSGHQYLLVATDRSLSGCDGTDDPQQGACAAMTVRFLGDKGGVLRIDTVGGNTQIVQ